MSRPAVLAAIGLAAIAVCAAPVHATTGTTTSAGPLAFIAELSGRVDVARSASKTSERGTLGLGLQRGDKLQISTGGKATLLFNDGNLLELPEKSTFTIAPRAKSAGGSDPLMASVFKSVSDGVVGGSREAGLVALAPVRGASKRMETILAPRQTEILEDRPTFRWQKVAGAQRYRIVVSGESGEIWRGETTDTTLAYPSNAKPLARGGDLAWELHALGDGGAALHDEESGFRIKPSDEAKTIREGADKIEKSAGDAGPFLVGAYLGGQGLYFDAIDRFQQLCAEHPAQPGPHEALGQLYRAVGLMDLAATELQTALTLNKQP